MYATGNDFVDTYLLSNCIKTNKPFNGEQSKDHAEYFKYPVGTEDYTYIYT